MTAPPNEDRKVCNAPENAWREFLLARQSGPASKPQADKALSSNRTPNAKISKVRSRKEG
ncbi:MAG: hypothetical protein DMG06_18375 [Acidobacteria bacterium]|nr:MAG: hypothetical protein DMG06_18375 [Acidobacteriota bacterium]